jgi:hypothetical protein
VNVEAGTGVWVGIRVLVGVGGSEVAIDEALPHPLNRNNSDKANANIFFIGIDGSLPFQNSTLLIAPEWKQVLVAKVGLDDRPQSFNHESYTPRGRVKFIPAFPVCISPDG